jgi:hypothetical protein
LLIKKEENKKCLGEAAVLEEVDTVGLVEDLVLAPVGNVYVQIAIIVRLI